MASLVRSAGWATPGVASFILPTDSASPASSNRCAPLVAFIFRGGADCWYGAPANSSTPALTWSVTRGAYTTLHSSARGWCQRRADHRCWRIMVISVEVTAAAVLHPLLRSTRIRSPSHLLAHQAWLAY